LRKIRVTFKRWSNTKARFGDEELATDCDSGFDRLRIPVNAPSAASVGIRSVLRAAGIWLLLLLIACLCGCASGRPPAAAESRKFEFSKDTFAYANELVWEYAYDANGHWTTRRRQPKPTYALHCYVVARSAYQFFENARFDPQQPRVDETAYRQLIRRVIATNPRKPLPPGDRVIIPGYPDLRSFSEDNGALLKAECGGAWQSYFQRGNWRLIFPFTRHQQLEVARRVMARLQEDHPVLAHVVRFPQLTINHTVLIFAANELTNSVQFVAYDPNQPGGPLILTFDYGASTFVQPPCDYFPGGRVDVYEICHRWDY